LTQQTSPLPHRHAAAAAAAAAAAGGLAEDAVWRVGVTLT